jgi:proteasome lid subunit RPN8/RPN11
MKTNKLKIQILLWRRLLHQLRRRGSGERESGAFLLGKPGASRISRFICYDDLDETALETGIITFHAVGFVRLWEICETESLKVLADVHTHPSAWTGQSESDRTHPMIAMAGHVAVILPHFAQRTKSTLNGAGVYEYLGNHEWKTWPVKHGWLMNSPRQLISSS